jgi:ABC-2 type transport system permease protein
VYYNVTVLPAPLRAVARFSPATYTLDGIRSSIIGGTGVGGLWHDLWPLMVIGAVSIPLGLWVFHRGEVHAKRHGKLKRSG